MERGKVVAQAPNVLWASKPEIRFYKLLRRTYPKVTVNPALIREARMIGRRIMRKEIEPAEAGENCRAFRLFDGGIAVAKVMECAVPGEFPAGAVVRSLRPGKRIKQWGFSLTFLQSQKVIFVIL